MALFLAFVFAIILYIFIVFVSGKDLNKIKAFVILIPFFLTTGIIFSLLVLSDTPQAIDVYRGNTTLKITYKDGVAIDSTVVFKNK